MRKKYSDDFAKVVSKALRRAAHQARIIARIHGTPIYIWRDGKIVVSSPDTPQAVRLCQC